MAEVLQPRPATTQEAEAIQKATDILNSAGLELIGTRPKRRV